MSTTPPGPRVGRPWALTALWVLLMAPLSLAGTALQARTSIPYEVFPLVMVGPALAALACRLLVPRWFPAPEPSAPTRLVLRSLGATLLVGVVFAAIAAAFLDGGSAALPAGRGFLPGLVAAVVGLVIGSLLEEIGYRGVMYRALAARMRPVLAIIVNGVFFGLCHLQYFGAGALAVAFFLLSAVFMDVVIVALWTGSWTQRVLLAALFHGVLNVALALIGDPQTSLRSFAVLALSTGAAALAAVLLGRRLHIGDLGRAAD